MISSYPDWFDRIRWYTRPTNEERLRDEYQLREQILKAAREVEEIAATLQNIADELRDSIR